MRRRRKIRVAEAIAREPVAGADEVPDVAQMIAQIRARRADPKTLWPRVCSVVMLAMNYGPPDDPLEATRRSSAGAISVYARHRD